MFSFQLGYGVHFRLCVRLPPDRKSRCLTRQKRGGWYSGCWFSLFLSLGVRTTPDHKFGRAHLKNGASRGAKLKFWKIKFLQLFHSKSGALYVKTPHFRAAFSALHLSSTHFVGCWQKRCRSKVLCRKGLRAFEARFSVLQFEPPASCDDGWMICKCVRESVN